MRKPPAPDLLPSRRPTRARAIGSMLAVIMTGLALGGCSTPGPLHLYSTTSGAREIHDVAVTPDVTQQTPSYLGTDDVLTGFAYDPFTDHFFLRLAPGNHIRVVDRPARKIKREFQIEGGPSDIATGGGDLAVSPRDGHLFLVDVAVPDVIETTRFGKFIRRIPLQGRTTPAAAIAFDPTRNQLLVLNQDGRTMDLYSAEGRSAGTITLARKVAPSLAYDGTRAEIYAPLVEMAATVGVFATDGAELRTLPISSADRFIDVGPHSLIRVF